MQGNYTLCDRCEVEIKVNHPLRLHTVYMFFNLELATYREDIDLCNECSKGLKEYLERKL